MSRIDEALRRAAEEGDDVQVDQSLPLRHDDQDGTGADHEVVALSNEPFPIELASRASSAHAGRGPRSSVHPHGGHAQTNGTRPGASSVPPHESATGGARNPAESIFERIDHSLAEKIVADRNISPISREQYRRLAAVLHDAQANTGLRVVMIASALSGEGKTLTASNLALTLSESYQRRVLLIDADLRKPTLHQVFRIESTLGLSTGLESPTETKLTVHQVSPKLSVLPAGRPTSDPMAGLISDRMRRLIEEARETFDWVIIDTPPVVLIPDANLLAAMVDATVLVIRANSTPHNLVKRAAEAIGARRIIGTVLNQAESASGARYGAYSGYYYGNGQHYLSAEDKKSQV